MQNTIFYFDRHASMSSETRQEVLSIIRELLEVDCVLMENWLYGLFDGYDYSGTDRFIPEVEKIAKQNPQLALRIIALYQVVDEYELTTEPNHGQF